MKIEEIQQTHTRILHKLDELHEIQSQTHTQYKEYIEKNKTNKVFGLDSFYYQSRLYDLEMKHIKEQYSFINNRIYCDYYKLYGMVKTFYKEQFKLEPKKRNYIPYKDLEPFKLFEFSDSMNLNQDISDMIKKSLENIHKREEEIETNHHTIHRINIDNYIYNHRYNNEMLKTKVELYEKYLHSYHIYHMSFLSNLLNKITLIFGQNTHTVSMDQLEKISVKSGTNTLTSTIVPEVPVVSEVPVVNAVQELYELVDSVTEPVIESVTPVVVPVSEPATPVVEPVTPVVEPVVVPVSEPVTPIDEPVSEPVTPVSEPVTPVVEPVTPVSEPVSEPVTHVVEPATPVEVISVEVMTEPATPIEVTPVVEPATPVEVISVEVISEPATPVEVTPVVEPVTPVVEVVSEPVTPVVEPVSEPTTPVEPASPAPEKSKRGKAKKAKK